MSAKRMLITQSLLSSWNYLYSCNEEHEEEAFADFQRTLHRERIDPTEAMQNGIEFEREVYKAVAKLPRKPHKSWERGINAVATAIRGATTQVKLSSTIYVGGDQFILYGVLDALRASVIYDVKFTNKSLTSANPSYEFGKYLESAQHPAYFKLVPEAREFVYLTSDGVDLCTETYKPHSTRPIEEIITEFMCSLDSMGLMTVYLEKWEAR